ncbi:transcription-associated protein 1 isoform X2 [Aethina tumida]|uniref:transcription-associated protein 1 isoform X2 n=1 Tax=Aethina tumida TaxID=116153 RepID=UPI002147AF75|nr:transcription-associated protein 1 isoform X2 [Aethina tumida]
MQSASVAAAADPHVTQMNEIMSYVTALGDPNCTDDSKLKAAQKISKNFEVILSSTHYPHFLDHSVKIFLKILEVGKPHFIAEYNIQQVRKLILEMLYRLPTNEQLRPYVKPILLLMLKLLEIDNEENVLVCLKIIIELHKQYRPQFSVEIQRFLRFVKTIYSELPNHMDKIFEPRPPIKVKDLNELNIEELLKETFTMTTIQTEVKNDEGNAIAYYLIPKAVLSLKVLQELPIIVVLMYQLYKQSVHQDVSDFIPLIMNTITLQPTLEQRQAETFNKEIFVDFMGAQIKTLSFLAYIIKLYQEVVQNHAPMMVQGMLGLLTLCPMEVAHLRRELLIAARHILATELRNQFVPHMERLFDEDILLGRGWTTHESLRPLAYSTLADLVHHVRQQLPLSDLTKAVHLFSKNVHDDSLATTIQTMSCKLLLNLVECIRHSSENSSEGRELLMRMLEVFVLKFKTIAKIQLPILISNEQRQQQYQQQQQQQTAETVKTEEGVTTKQNVAEQLESALASTQPANPPEKEKASRFGFPQNNNHNVADYRSLVKTLVCGVKTIAWSLPSCKIQTPTGQALIATKHFQPHETLVFVRLVKWALKALDIYTLNVTPPNAAGPQRLNQQNVRTKEEKEVLEHFSGVFSTMNPQTFHEIFSTTIEYVVERVYKNPNLQTVPSTLLANPATSPIFATVLVEYLLERMEEMGSNMDRSNLYLRQFKLVFGSVSLFAQENENMLRPHLHQIVNRSMELAMSAAEPYNYFLLLRALFRSIGGGSHDLLYQEFLPLLPNLLEGLNRLQSGLHKQHMKDLFVELCLTVPVRLSSLLPYLPMLMDPLVSALNGSQVLISQGLRTLELCVDNLQHDFLYEHIQPVRADLMQALWRTLRNNDQVAQVAFKVLGKFGGGNRKMMIEPQKLDYVASDYDPPAIIAQFHDQEQAIEFPVQKIIETAFNALKQSNTDPFYRKQAWEVINCYLTASRNHDDDRATLVKLFLHPSFKDPKTVSQIKGSTYKSIYAQARETHQTALTGMFVGAAIKELRQSVIQALFSVVRHYTMVAVAQQSGAFAQQPRPNRQVALDPLVLVDALAVIMGHEERELCKPGQLGLVLIVDTATDLLGSREMACRLPLVEYLAEKMCGLCYERAWYAKLGGCIAIKFMFERCALKWVYEHMFTFLKALLFVMMDLTGEVSNGALDMAKENLKRMLCVLVEPPPATADQQTKDLQNDALQKVTHELVRQVTSPHTMVREQSMASLRLLAEKQEKSVTEVMEPFKEVLADMVPPKKHLLRHQPAIAQMGLMDGNMFCTTLTPRLFTIDVNIKEHKNFIDDLKHLCDTEETKLNTFACYKSITNFIPLKSSALRVLSACHYIESQRESIFQVLYRALEKPNGELQETAFQCIKKFIAGYTIDTDLVKSIVRPLLWTLGDVKNLTLNRVKMLSYLTQLFPLVFNEKLCEQLLEILKQMLQNLTATHKNQQYRQYTCPSTQRIFIRASTGISKKGDEEQKIVTIISIFHQTPAASSKFITQLCQLILQTEQAMLIEASSPFREVLMKFLLRYPLETLDMFLDDNFVKEKQYNRYLEYLLKHKEGKVFKDQLIQQRMKRVITMSMAVLEPSHAHVNLSLAHRNQMQFQAIKIVTALAKEDDSWLNQHTDLLAAFRRIWCDDAYHERHKNVEDMEYAHWREPKLLAKILLKFFVHFPKDIDLLFQLLRAFTERFIPEFQFLKEFLENTVAQSYTVDWKRQAFFRFVELFPTNEMSQELKSKVLQLILIPSFAHSFEKGETNKLIGGPPMPYQDSADNVVSVFINRLIDPDPNNPFPWADCVRISLLQFSCLLVEQASPHIHDHDANNKTQGFKKLRRLMTFAWPCLMGENCVDPATRYHGHLLLSHIINKFAIHKKIILQVFHGLLKAHAVEARNVVRQALEILTPSMPLRMDEEMLTHWTKKIIVDEGHSMQQLFHILQLVVKHYKVYYTVRHDLVQHMVNSIQRLGFSPTATLEHRKLAVELAEVIIKWELYGIKEESEITEATETVVTPMKRPASEEGGGPEVKRRMSAQPGTSAAPATVKVEPGTENSIEKAHIETVLNFLLRLACQVNDATPPNPQNQGTSSPGELLSRRCVILLKTALKPELWSRPVDLKLAFFDKILLTVETPNPNVANICTALEVLTYLLTVLKKEQILASFKMLQRGISACIQTQISKIIKLVHNLLTKLMSMFPMERTATNASSKYDELDGLYLNVGKVISEGLSKFEKMDNPSNFFSTVMILKAACINNHSYIDLLITPFMASLQRLAKEHLQPSTNESGALISELLILCLDLVKTRVVVMGGEMRKNFIGTILVGLIEKSPDNKVMKAITKMLEEWMKCRNIVTINQAPSLREKSILLVKLMQYVEKRFPDDQELNAQFLELINYVYTDRQFKNTELTSKLEAAFLAGLRCNQPAIRAKFFRVFDDSMRRRLHDRLLYIVCSQNWEAIGSHYWIKQCIELLLVTAIGHTPIKMSHESSILPSVTSVVVHGDKQKKEEFQTYTQQESWWNLLETVEVKEEVVDMDLSVSQTEAGSQEEKTPASRAETITKMINKHYEFIEVSRNVSTNQFLVAASQLCHMDTNLAEQVWLALFPRLWAILEEEQRSFLTGEILPFLTSGSHIVQKDCHPSAINTFVEALCRCNPPVQLAPPVMKYIGKSHNLWHRMALGLEQMAYDNGSNVKPSNPASCYDFESDQSKNELVHSLAELYSLLCEEDMWAGVWQKHAYYKETGIAVAYEQHGFFEQAQAAYEAAMNKYKQDTNAGPVPAHTQREVLLWNQQWIRCAKELNQWEIIVEYAKNPLFYDALLLLDSAWRTTMPNWDLMKEALSCVEYSCPKELGWKVTMYGGFLLICQPDETKPLKFVERYVETASALCLNEWRRLPTIVSHIHLPYLQAAQQIMELHEAFQIHKGLTQRHQTSVHDMKAIVKTWRNRLPVIADDLTHWNDIFTWRQLHYQVVVSHFESVTESNTANSMLGVHASAQSIIHFGKIARKHKLSSVCLETLNRIYTIPSVPIVDCFQKVRQQVKCYLQMASMNNKNELQEGLDVINHTKVQFFQKEMTAEFYALKGMMYHLSNKSDEANKAFSAAVQMHDTSTKAWALYGDYLEQVFTRDQKQINLGVNAMTCFLHACRQQNESKARKYLAKVLWLLSYDDEKGSLMEALDKYAVGVPPIMWLPWTPQLLNLLVQYEGGVIINLLMQVGRMFPQAVYFPIRTLYLTLRSATQRNKANPTGTQQAQEGGQTDGQQQQSAGAENGQTAQATPSVSSASDTIKATPGMVRCSKIMKMQRDIHTTVLSSLEGIAVQMEWFRECWYEEVLRQLRQGLTKCYAIAFENRENVKDAKITPHILNFVKKLITTFGIGVENIHSSSNITFNSAASESLARRAEATYQDPVFKEMKQEFSKDFDFSHSNSCRLHTLIFKLKKWIKILDKRSKMLLQSFLIEEKCRFLSNFTLKTAEVELPGEFLLPKHNHYFVRIARFMPRVDVVQKHNASARRLYIRGHNGKIYPYLVVNDSGLADARREERVLQLLRMLNHCLGKQKETSRRFLHYTVPRVVAVSQQIRLVEDNPASISLLDVFKKGCAKLNIEHDDPIHYFYDRLANVQSRGIKASHQVFRDILKGVQTTMVPRTVLKQWAVQTFPNATDYWQFRKMFTLQLALACFAEYVLHLTRLNPDMMYLHQDSGMMNISYFKFDVDDGELDTTRPVPFRLTPNIIEYLSSIGINGPLTASMIATARCFVYPNFKVTAILKPILRDEMVLSRMKKPEDATQVDKLTDSEQIVNMVNKAVTSISSRLNNLALFDGVESKVGTLVAAASSHDNLCRMDPAWHPWL